MQELPRSDYDSYEEQVESGGYVADPQVLCIKKGICPLWMIFTLKLISLGTIIPSALTLFRESLSRFSLQPSHPMALKDLNSILNESYSTSAMITSAVEWMERNEFYDAFADSATEDWLRY
ncbi:hypothetical protein PENDEC_c008G05378 [Penicillium decumbens]|uniref:Tse2 ADP-ribosyltransferase toxin domain-containing protein n=1 Tax=Penicillium decumbens TaxID=69771 RepID=A0A1V6PDI8_PENDC|nr:hypothetical protein PENDEC_c008G05378 [Penicillium decumbens]